MQKPQVSSVNINKVANNQFTSQLDLLAVEEPLEIRIGFGDIGSREQKSISVTMRTPGFDFELALGFLFTEGIIADVSQIETIKYCTELNTHENHFNIVRVELKPEINIDLSFLQRNFYTSSSCGICGKASIDAIKTNCKIQSNQPIISLTKELISSLPEKLRTQQNVFEHTGGLHAAALFNTNSEIILLREDVGRHNALDKLIGANVGSNQTFSDKILLLSGRASFELIQKAAMAGIPLVCAIGAPSSLAVETAKEFNISLIGFLKQHSFNIYHQAHNLNLLH